jgi:hypothetical protein
MKREIKRDKCEAYPEWVPPHPCPRHAGPGPVFSADSHCSSAHKEVPCGHLCWFEVSSPRP